MQKQIGLSITLLNIHFPVFLASLPLAIFLPSKKFVLKLSVAVIIYYDHNKLEKEDFIRVLFLAFMMVELKQKAWYQ